MDPAAPNYDRPPDRRRNRRRALTRVSGPLVRNGSDAFVPPKPQGVKGLGPGSLQGAQSLGLASGPQKGNLSTVDRFKAAGLEPPKNASEIGFFNATHKHGEPMKNLIAKLKRRRNSNKGSGQASYQPANGISSSR